MDKKLLFVSLGALEGWKGAGGSRPSNYDFKKKKIAAISLGKVDVPFPKIL